MAKQRKSKREEKERRVGSWGWRRSQRKEENQRKKKNECSSVEGDSQQKMRGFSLFQSSHVIHTFMPTASLE